MQTFFFNYQINAIIKYLLKFILLHKRLQVFDMVDE